MNRMQLATLVDWAGENGLVGRGRFQSVVYLLQQADCPLGGDFVPNKSAFYSEGVAYRLDEMTEHGFLEEEQIGEGLTRTYQYRLPPLSKSLLAKNGPDHGLKKYEELARDLLARDEFVLDITCAMCNGYRRSNDWDEALEDGCIYGSVLYKDGPEVLEVLEAWELAKRVLGDG